MNVSYTVFTYQLMLLMVFYTGKAILIIIEIPMRAPVIPSITSGFTFTPRVSSSKNLNNPALDAGNGAFFFFPSPNVKVHDESCLKYIPFYVYFKLENLNIQFNILVFSKIIK